MLILMAITLVLIGLYAVVVKKDLVKIVVGVIVMEIAADLFMIKLGEHGGLTSLVGLAALMLLIVIVALLADRYGTLDVTKIRELRG
jgi:multicomponent Na+:H+ antiporter subunit C